MLPEMNIKDLTKMCRVVQFGSQLAHQVDAGHSPLLTTGSRTVRTRRIVGWSNCHDATTPQTEPVYIWTPI